MITVLESIKLATEYLNGKGIESGRANAELLLADILKCRRLDLYLLFDRPLTDTELQLYRGFLKRRGIFEPLQYILGKIEFYGIELKVTPDVLIPRPETELLVENVLNHLSKENEQLILDIGCGSGNIDIALALNSEKINVFATDIDEKALNLASENAEKHNVASKIKFFRHNILKDESSIFPMFDFVVSNPPYVSKETYLTLQREIREFEPGIAVSDGGDGYTFYRTISEKISKKIKPKGKLFFEVAEGQSNSVVKIMEQNNFKDITVKKDYQKIDRIVYGEVE